MVYRLGGRAYGLVSPEFHISFLAFDEGDSVSSPCFQTRFDAPETIARARTYTAAQKDRSTTFTKF